MSNRINDHLIEAVVKRIIDEKYAAKVRAIVEEIIRLIMIGVNIEIQKNPLKFTKAQLDSGLVSCSSQIGISIKGSLSALGHYLTKFGVDKIRSYSSYRGRDKYEYHLQLSLPKGIRIPAKSTPTYPQSPALSRQLKTLQTLLEQVRDTENSVRAVVTSGKSIPKLLKEHPYLEKYFRGAPEPKASLDLKRVLAA